MSGEAARAVFFCLATGAALGGLFVLFQAVRILLRAGKLFTAFLDLLYCCLCGAAVFLCALAVDRGRLRFFQAALQLLGGWSVVAALGPAASRLAGGVRKIIGKISGAFHRAAAVLAAHFHKSRPKPAKKRVKTGRKRKKAQKKT